MTDIVEGPTLAALSCGKPAYLVVLLHGLRYSGQAMIDQALNWAPTMPKAEFLAAETPFAGDDADATRQWFDPKSADGVGNVAPRLDRFLDQVLAKRRLPASHLALVGFSEGATLALHVGLRRSEQIAAIVAFSGIYDAESVCGEIRTRPPTLLIHGETDPVAPFSTMLESKAALKARGVPVKSLRRPELGHQMDDDGVTAAGDFLAAHFVHKSALQRGDHDHPLR
jgi:phospholipase/carboxylesterase